MNRFIPRHVQNQLLLLVMIAMLPQFVTVTYHNYQDLRLNMASARSRAVAVAEIVASQQKNLELSSLQLLSTLAVLPEVKKMDSVSCDILFAQLMTQNPQFHTLAAIAADGNSFASSVQGQRAYLGDRKYFKDAMANRAFSFGESVISRSFHRPTFHYSIPFNDMSGKLSGVLFLAVDLREVASLIDMTNLPHRSEVSLYDHAGKQLLLVAGHGSDETVALPSKQLEIMLKGDEKGSFTYYHNKGGDSHIAAYRRMVLDGSKVPHLFVRVAIPEKEITIPVYEEMGRQMLRLCSTTVIALILAWFVGEYLVARKVKRIIDVAEKLGRGNLKERTDMVETEGEIGQLAGAIDWLGASLEQEDERRASVEEELRTLNVELEERVRERTSALRELVEFNNQIIESVGEGIVVCDLELCCKVWNPYMEKLTGIPASQVIGKKPVDLFPFLEESGIAERLGKALSGEYLPPLEVECHLPATGKSDWVTDGCSPLRNSAGEITGTINTVHNITFRKQVEEQLIQSRKLESVGRLAGGIAHDFNNKLSVIMGYAQLADDELSAADETIREYLSEITQAAEFSRDITAQLLAFSRQQLILPQIIDPNLAISGMQKSLARLIGEDIRLIFNSGDQVANISIDPVQLDQIMMNLALNARDAMQDGGTLTIETSTRFMAEDSPDHPAGDYVMITVSDTGCGMDKETLRHIFEPFFTTKEVGKGTGLGLATVHGIIAQNNGCIDVESSPGSGTSFKILFPCRTKPDPVGIVERESHIQGDVSILLVEDDDSVRTVTAKLLKRTGYNVTECQSPQRAIEIFEQGDAPFDLILTDVIMPGMNGREMAERIKGINSGVRVIYMSGYPRDVISQKGVAGDDMILIQKPVDIEELKRMIAKMVKGGREEND